MMSHAFAYEHETLQNVRIHRSWRTTKYRDAMKQNTSRRVGLSLLTKTYLLMKVGAACRLRQLSVLEIDVL